MRIVTKQVDEGALAVLSGCEVTAHSKGGTAVEIPAKYGQLDRKLYLKVNEVLEELGGKWQKVAKAHIFFGDAEVVKAKLDATILAGEISPAKLNGFFPTPPELAHRLIEEARILPHHTFLEPSFGNGRLILAAIKAGVRNIHGMEFHSHLIAQAADAIEALPDTVANKANVTLFNGDFMDSRGLHPQLSPSYQRVAMNPPFEMLADCKHVLHAYSYLCPGGRLVAIMSPGVKFRRERPAIELRELIECSGGLIQDLPPNSFAASGTNVSTIILTLERKS